MLKILSFIVNENNECIEYAFITFVNKQKVILNEEHIEYKWIAIDEFINEIKWYGDKKELKKILKCALKKKLYFEKEKIENF